MRRTVVLLTAALTLAACGSSTESIPTTPEPVVATPSPTPAPTIPPAPEAIFAADSQSAVRFPASCYAATLPSGPRLSMTCPEALPPNRNAATSGSRYSIQMADDSIIESVSVTAAPIEDGVVAGAQTSLDSTHEYDEVRFEGIPPGDWLVRTSVIWANQKGIRFEATFELWIAVSE